MRNCGNARLHARFLFRSLVQRRLSHGGFASCFRITIFKATRAFATIFGTERLHPERRSSRSTRSDQLVCLTDLLGFTPLQFPGPHNLQRAPSDRMLEAMPKLPRATHARLLGATANATEMSMPERR